jgi:hypothetical protein
VHHDDITELHLRAIRILETRVRSFDGEVTPTQLDRLLALELAEAESSLALVAALATVGGAMIVMIQEATGLSPEVVFERMREMLADAV